MTRINCRRIFVVHILLYFVFGSKVPDTDKSKLMFFDQMFFCVTHKEKQRRGAMMIVTERCVQHSTRPFCIVRVYLRVPYFLHDRKLALIICALYCTLCVSETMSRSLFFTLDERKAEGYSSNTP